MTNVCLLLILWRQGGQLGDRNNIEKLALYEIAGVSRFDEIFREIDHQSCVNFVKTPMYLRDLVVQILPLVKNTILKNFTFFRQSDCAGLTFN